MREGFYNVAVSGEAGEGRMLVHLKAGRLVGFDQGGCAVTGGYAADGGRVAVDLVYHYRAGSRLVTGVVMAADSEVAARLDLGEGVFDGGAETVDIGMGPSEISAVWLGPPA